MSPADLFTALVGPQHRRALGRAITLVESSRPEDLAPAAELIALAERHTPLRPTFRLGISGTPGVGKSTFIEAYGQELVRRGHRLAVLAIDPTSSLSGGSILGDKTRMELLTRLPEVYIRPSPNAGELGGVGPASRAAVLLCEAAGYDYVIVETVGVGQSEWQVHSMTDAFLLLAQPASGDELQGIKRGILELADHLVVNKADSLPREARLAAAELRRSLHLAPARPDGWDGRGSYRQRAHRYWSGGGGRPDAALPGATARPYSEAAGRAARPLATGAAAARTATETGGLPRGSRPE